MSSFVECCGKKHKAIVFELKLSDNSCYSKILKSAYCPFCGKNVVVIEKKMFVNGVEKFRYIRRMGREADKLFDSVEKDILCKVIEYSNVSYKNGFYLNCNEYGKVKKCYSNLSSLKLGLLDNTMNFSPSNRLLVNGKSFC